MIEQLDLRAYSQQFVDIVPDLRFAQEQQFLAGLSGGPGVAMIFVFRPQHQVTKQTDLIPQEILSPIQRVLQIMASLCKVVIAVHQVRAPPGIAQLKGIRRADHIGVIDGIAIPGFAVHPESAGIFEVQKRREVPKFKGMGYLCEQVAGIVMRALEIHIHFHKHRAIRFQPECFE